MKEGTYPPSTPSSSPGGWDIAAIVMPPIFVSILTLNMLFPLHLAMEIIIIIIWEYGNYSIVSRSLHTMLYIIDTHTHLIVITRQSL